MQFCLQRRQFLLIVCPTCSSLCRVLPRKVRPVAGQELCNEIGKVSITGSVSVCPSFAPVIPGEASHSNAYWPRYRPRPSVRCEEISGLEVLMFAGGYLSDSLSDKKFLSEVTLYSVRARPGAVRIVLLPWVAASGAPRCSHRLKCSPETQNLLLLTGILMWETWRLCILPDPHCNVAPGLPSFHHSHHQHYIQRSLNKTMRVSLLSVHSSHILLNQ